MIETANSLFTEKNFSEAGDLFENIISIDPQKKEAVSGYIRSLISLKKFDAADEFIKSLDEKMKEDNLIKIKL